MKNQKGRNCLKLLTCVALLSGCAQIPKSAGFPDVQKIVRERTNYRVHWNRGTPEDEKISQTVKTLLSKEMTDKSAVQVALLNNRSLQAIYEDLGISQAEVVSAGQLRNPEIFGMARFPTRGDFGYNLEFEGAVDFLDFLMIPARKQLAEGQFKRAKLLVGNEVFRLVSEVQSAYYTAVAAKQLAGVRQEISKGAKSSFELSKRMYEAGNLSDLDLANQQGAYESARIEWAKAETEALSTRERLSTLLSLWGKDINWKVQNQLPAPPKNEMDLARLEALAVAQRLDLGAARQESETIAHALSIARQQGGIGSAEIGVSTERETHGGWVLGPVLKFELPIFHQGQTKLSRLESQLRQSELKYEAQAIEIRSDVRDLRNHLVAQRNLIEHHRKVMIPVRERIVALTLKKYNFMLTGIFDLIAAKQNEFDVYQAYIEAIRDYWITRAKLRLAVGGRLPGEKESKG